jgi:hypothetical protein
MSLMIRIHTDSSTHLTPILEFLLSIQLNSLASREHLSTFQPRSPWLMITRPLVQTVSLTSSQWLWPIHAQLQKLRSLHLSRMSHSRYRMEKHQQSSNSHLQWQILTLNTVRSSTHSRLRTTESMFTTVTITLLTTSSKDSRSKVRLTSVDNRFWTTLSTQISQQLSRSLLKSSTQLLHKDKLNRPSQSQSEMHALTQQSQQEWLASLYLRSLTTSGIRSTFHSQHLYPQLQDVQSPTTWSTIKVTRLQ